MPPEEIIYGLEQVSRQQHLKLKSQLECFGLKWMRGQLHLCKVIEWEIHSLILYMWMTSYLLVVMSIYCWKEGVLVLKVQRKYSQWNVSHCKNRESLRWRKGVLGILYKHAKKSFMHARKSKPALTVKGNDFGNFSVPRISVKDQMDMVPYASAVGSSMNAQVWYYPKVVHISRLFWQCPVQI